MPKALDVDSIRADFPLLKTEMNGVPIVYLDSASTSQKPHAVIAAIEEYYKRYNANVHRGIYKLSEEATEKYKESKEKVAQFINAGSANEIVYTRNTTEAVNLVANTWGMQNIQKGDRILITEMEHHSNMVPWMVLAKKKGAILEFAKMDKQVAHLDMEDFKKRLEKKPKLVAMTHMSNVLGTINNAKELTRLAHKEGAKVLIDGAQSVPHMKVDMRDIDCDFMALSGHKMLAPTGIGVLYGKQSLLEKMEPFMTGGGMIEKVQYSGWSPAQSPEKFEAGTPNIEGAIAMTTAINYLEKLGMESIRAHEISITKYALEALKEVKGVKLYGVGIKEIERRGGVISFAVEGVHPHDVSQIFDSEGIAIRAGHHCAMPLVTERIGVPALSRMSFYIYNRNEDVDKAIHAIETVKRTFRMKK